MSRPAGAGSLPDALLRQAELMERAIDTGRILFVALDAGSRVVRLNPLAERRSGYTADELRGRDYCEALVPESARPRVREWLATAEPGPLEHPIRTKGGAEREIEWCGTRLVDDGGRAVGTLCVGHDATNGTWAEDALRAVLEGTAPTTGEHFFRSLARHVAAALDVRFAFAAEVVDDAASRARTLGLWAGDDYGGNFEYEIAGTPCEGVVGGTPRVWADGLRARFPDARRLAWLGAESYLAVPLSDATGRTIGHIGVLDDRPMTRVDRKLSILRILAARAGAELERVRVEAALRENERRFRQLAENVDEVFWLCSGDLETVIYVSPAYERIWGRSTQALYGSVNDWIDAIHPDDRQRVAERYAARVLHGTYEEDYRVVRPDGSIRWINDRGFPIEDASGRVYRVAGIAADITERRQVQEALRKSEAQANAFFDQSRVGMAVVDLGGRMLRLNDAFAEMLGYHPEDLIGRRIADVTHEDDVQKSTAFFERLATGATDRQQLDKRYRRRDGTVVWGRVTASLARDPQGRPEFAFGLIEDVTERKRAEEERSRLLAILEVTTDLVGMCDAQGRALYMNPAGRRMVGLPDDTDVRGLSIAQFHPPAEAERVLRDVLPAANRTGFWTGETVLRRLDGREIPTLQVVLAHHAPNGDLEYFSTITRDITERKQAERLQEHLFRTQKLEAIGTLAGGIAHDFNNILAAIRGFTEVSLPALPEGSVPQANLREVLCACDRAKELVRQILMFSRPGSVDRKPLPLHRIVGNALGFLRALLPASVDLRSDVDPASGLVLANPAQMEQVLLNLAVNASQAMARGGTLEIGLRRVDVDDAAAARLSGVRPGPHAHLTVRDTGCGMTPEVIGRIFEPFFTTKPVGEGSGMGMAIAHGIVTAHGGDIAIESRPGAGTLMGVYLPICEDADVAEETPTPAPPRRGRGRVLLVDDEQTIRAMGRQMLEQLGYRAVVTTNGAEALAAVRADPAGFDAVVTDEIMPQMNGATLATELLRIRPDLPIILCTGYSDRLTEARAREVGFRGYLTKPVSLSDLGQALRVARNGG